jgi:hypothetical protein
MIHLSEHCKTAKTDTLNLSPLEMNPRDEERSRKDATGKMCWLEKNPSVAPSCGSSTITWDFKGLREFQRIVISNTEVI